MPLHRRLPKYGFTNINKVTFKAINLDTLQILAEKTKITKITTTELHAAGLISKNDVVKILGNGALTTKLDVSVHAFSKSAIAAIETLGGTATKL